MTLRHFIITRNSYPDDYPNMDQRIQLVRSFTLPSLRNQVNQDYTWLVTGDRGLTATDMQGIPNIVVSPGRLAVPERAREVIAETATPGDLIITTRFDNDDILLPNYVAEVQTLAAEGYMGLVDLRGYRADLRYGKIYEDIVYPTSKMPSPFISLIETYVSPLDTRTVLFDHHEAMKKHAPLRRVESFGWVQTIHHSNKLINKRSEEHVQKRSILLDVTPAEFLAKWGFTLPHDLSTPIMTNS